LLATGVTFVTNWFALQLWRRSKGAHWTEQARVVFPVFVAARSNIMVVPGILVLAVLLLWPNSAQLWLFTGIVSILGAYIGTLSISHEVFPRIPFIDLVRQAVIDFLLKSIIWLIFICAVVFMPRQFNRQAWEIAVSVVALRVMWAQGGLVGCGRALGLFVAAPERLSTIAADMSAKMRIPYRAIFLMRSPMAQAFALLGSRELLFTERLLGLLSDTEIASIVAHELAHLSESASTRYSRSILTLVFTPWIFFNPLVHNFGMFGFLGLCMLTILIPKIYRRISLKLESRADRFAVDIETDAGTYARALTKLYEDNLLPAVTGNEQTTHPHLYDRILAAGMTPDFPRPEAAASISWYGRVLGGLAGLLLAIFVITNLEKWSAAVRPDRDGISEQRQNVSIRSHLAKQPSNTLENRIQ